MCLKKRIKNNQKQKLRRKKEFFIQVLYGKRCFHVWNLNLKISRNCARFIFKFLLIIENSWRSSSDINIWLSIFVDGFSSWTKTEKGFVFFLSINQINLPKFVADPYQKMDDEEIIVTKNKINIS